MQGIMIWRVMPLALAAFVSTPAFAADRGDCDREYGAANIRRVDEFKLSGGNADFGSGPIIFSSPASNAVVCWAIDGRVSVIGTLYADQGFDDPVGARVQVTFTDSQGNRTTKSASTFSNMVVAWTEVTKRSGRGRFNSVNVRLSTWNITDLGVTPFQLQASRTFRR